MKKTAAIVVTYNRKKLLIQNLEALLKQTVAPQMDILIIEMAISVLIKEFSAPQTLKIA